MNQIEAMAAVKLVVTLTPDQAAQIERILAYYGLQTHMEATG